MSSDPCTCGNELEYDKQITNTLFHIEEQFGCMSSKILRKNKVPYIFFFFVLSITPFAVLEYGCGAGSMVQAQVAPTYPFTGCRGAREYSSEGASTCTCQLFSLTAGQRPDVPEDNAFVYLFFLIICKKANIFLKLGGNVLRIFPRIHSGGASPLHWA